MKRLFVLAIVLMAMSAPTFAANVLVNGDFIAGELGWSRWRAGWGSTETYSTAGGVGTLSGAGGNGSFGWFQTVAVPVGTICTVSGDWTGTNVGWGEVMLWSQAAPGGEGGRADTGSLADIAFKREGGSWGWQSVTLSPKAGGNGGTIVSQGYVVVALKLGGFPLGSESFDNLVLDAVPEPGSIVALLSGFAGLGVMIRRKR